jgi:hypothetical protein
MKISIKASLAAVVLGCTALMAAPQSQADEQSFLDRVEANGVHTDPGALLDFARTVCAYQDPNGDPPLFGKVSSMNLLLSGVSMQQANHVVLPLVNEEMCPPQEPDLK